MELYQLRTFTTVAAAGSLGRASARLHLSQPAASAQIKALEDEFGVRLFDRRPQGLRLTPAGAELLPVAERLLATAGELSGRARALGGELAGRLHIGAVFDPHLVRVGELMGRLISRHPLLEIEVRHCNSRAVRAGVISGELDAGIALGEGALPGVATLTLARLRYRVVAPGAWTERIRRLPWNRIAAIPWISTPKGGSHDQMTAELFARHRFEPHKVIEVDSESMIASLVFAGVGFGLMREDLAAEAQAQAKAVVLPRGRASTLLRFIYPRQRETAPPIAALLGAVRELWPRAAAS